MKLRSKKSTRRNALVYSDLRMHKACETRYRCLPKNLNPYRLVHGTGLGLIIGWQSARVGYLGMNGMSQILLVWTTPRDRKWVKHFRSRCFTLTIVMKWISLLTKQSKLLVLTWASSNLSILCLTQHYGHTSQQIVTKFGIKILDTKVERCMLYGFFKIPPVL